MTLEEYYQKRKKSNFFLEYFEEIKRNGYLPILAEIIKINPHYDIKDFDSDFYCDKYIQNYGYQVLVKLENRIDISLLDSGLRDEEIKEKIIYFANFYVFNQIRKEFIYNGLFSIEFFDKIQTIFNKFEQVCILNLIYKSNYRELEKLKELLENDEYIFKIRYLITHLNDLTLSTIIKNIDLIYDKSGTIFIKALIASNFDLFLTDNNFYNLYQKYKHLFTYEIIIEAKTITDFFHDVNRDCYDIKNATDLANFYSIRRQYYLENRDLNKKIQSYFGMDINKLKSIIQNILEKNKKYQFLSNEEISLLLRIEELEDGPTILKNIELKYREICKKSIISNLIIPSKIGIVDITNENFQAIIHQIRLNGKQISRLFESDPSVWDKFFIEGAYISGTLVNQYSLGKISANTNSILGFSNLNSNDILDMGLNDIFSTVYYYYSGLINPKSNFVTIEEFMNSVKCSYNEITMRRFNQGISLKPSFTLTFDKITDFNLIMQDYFKIPIFVINSIKSAERMHNHNLILLNQKKLIQYGIYLYKFYASYMNNPEIIEKYFKPQYFENLLNNLINEYQLFKDNQTRNAILFIIDIIKEINMTYIFGDILDTESFRKKLAL